MKKPGGQWGRHLGLGAGGAVENSFQNAPLALANPIYNVGLGVSPILVGFALALPRIWELLIDPLIGSASDRARSRLGRRLPYIIGGLAGSLLLFVAMWCAPAGWSANSLGLWLIVTAFLFYTCYSFFAIPYAALTLESSTAGQDRIALMASRTTFANLSGIGINWLYWFCQRTWFSTPVAGMRWVGAAFGLMVTLCGVAVVYTALRQSADVRPSLHPTASPAQRGIYCGVLGLTSTRCMMTALLSTMVGFTLWPTWAFTSWPFTPAAAT